ncbi:hypothetical protein EXE53_15385 [Halorubrum sp. SD626R]|uniref:hypothetical protein n=1 Tax=Halorubrum sp. SD626R TaxID=1419722 RepID=UPI0010F7F876|nr:hypothetical protein [Halorubrum sp. SD626R]TKX79545.1 hypothetical protein EXE53_15385 [Halorubrum sp. SD626R]
MTGLTSPPYTDEDARTAVDGSNVAVEEANQANVADVASNADNADQLGGQSPSYFETPGGTGTSQKAGGYTTVLNDSGTIPSNDTITLGFNFGYDLVDAISWSGTIESDATVTGVAIEGSSFSANGDSGTKNFSARMADSGSIDLNNPFVGSGKTYDITVRVHVVPAGYHSHPL